MARARWLSAAVVAFATVAALALSEGVLRALSLYRPPAEPLPVEEPDLYRPHARLGYTLWPSRTAAHRYPRPDGPLIQVVSNSDGFRNLRDFGRPDPRPHVLIVGDSFVFGLGVPEEDRLTDQLERLEPGWRVDNMGMTGWGIDLMVRAIEHLGPRAGPDVVVLCIYTDDLRRLHPYYAGVGYPFAKFALEDGRLVSRPFAYPRAWERLRLAQALYHLRWRHDPDWLALNQALLDRYLELAKTLEFVPVVLFLPGTAEGERDGARRAFVSAWTASRHIRYADLTPMIRRAGNNEVFLPGNWHWSGAGHRLAAEQLQQLLRAALGGGLS